MQIRVPETADVTYEGHGSGVALNAPKQRF